MRRQTLNFKTQTPHISVKRYLILIAIVSYLPSAIFGAVISPGYYHLKGSIDGRYAITMELTISYWSDRGLLASGYYSYDQYKDPIKLYQWNTIIDKDSIRLATESEQEVFHGQIEGDAFKGVWYLMSGDHKALLKQYSFELKRDTTDQMPLRQKNYLDSVTVLSADKKNAFRSYYSSSFLYATDTGSALQNNLLKFYGSRSETKLERYMRARAVNLFHDFKETIRLLGQSLGHPGNWQEDYTINVLYNDSNLLSVEQVNTSNEGGRHGGYIATYASYSSADRRCLRLSDVILRSDTNALKRIWITHLRTAKWVRDEMSNDLAMQMNLPTKYYMTPKGVMLMFTTWAPGGGEFLAPIFVPFAELGDHLKRQPWMQL